VTALNKSIEKLNADINVLNGGIPDGMAGDDDWNKEMEQLKGEITGRRTSRNLTCDPRTHRGSSGPVRHSIGRHSRDENRTDRELTYVTPLNPGASQGRPKATLITPRESSSGRQSGTGAVIFEQSLTDRQEC
jgi:hypothetical protein